MKTRPNCCGLGGLWWYVPLLLVVGIFGLATWSLPSSAQESGTEKRVEAKRVRVVQEREKESGERRERERGEGERRERERGEGERRERERGAGERRGELYQLVERLAREVAALRREVAQLRNRVDGRRDGDRPREGDRPRVTDRPRDKERGEGEGKRDEVRFTQEMRERAAVFFRQRDKNGDKKLSLREMLSERQAKDPRTLAQAEALFKQGDRNRDNAWSIEEFLLASLRTQKRGDRPRERGEGEREKRRDGEPEKRRDGEPEKRRDGEREERRDGERRERERDRDRDGS